MLPPQIIMAPNPNNRDSFLRRLDAIINANIENEQFGVNQLAREMGMSRSNLHRMVKSYTGGSASAYICKVKLEKAVVLLSESSLTVSEVAFQCGFHSVSYFSRCFRDHFGYTPAESRNHPPERVEERILRKNRTERRNGHESRIRKISIALFLPVVLVLLTASILFIFWSPFEAGKKEFEKSIAVLPFINDSPDESEMYFINGTMDEILNSLCRIEGLWVVSRTSVEQYRNHPAPVRVIARELKVRYLLEGSGLKIGDTIRLNLQLIDAEHDRHVWVQSYSRSISEIFELQSEIAQSVAMEMKATITPEELRIIEIPPTGSQVAYELYLRAMEESDKFEHDPTNSEALRRAEELIRYALEYDPEFTGLYVSLAWIYWYWDGTFKEAPPSCLDSLRKYAFKAVATDDRNESALYVRGQYYFMTDQKKKAEEDFYRALETSPNLQEAYTGLGWVAYLVNDMVGAIKNLNKAARLDPGQPVRIKSLGEAYRSAGFREQSDECFRRVLLMTGDSARFYYELGVNAQFISGDPDRALALYQLGYSLDTNRIYCLSGIGGVLMEQGRYRESLEYQVKFMEAMNSRNLYDPYGSCFTTGFDYLMNGEPEKARQYFDEQLKYSNRILPENPSSHCILGMVYAAMGETEKAVEHLRALNRLDRIGMFSYRNLESGVVFSSILDDPEFQKIRSELMAKYRTEHERVRKWLKENNML